MSMHLASSKCCSQDLICQSLEAERDIERERERRKISRKCMRIERERTKKKR